MEKTLFILFKFVNNFLRIPVERQSLREKVESHKAYPSLLSITDTLKELGLTVTPAKLTMDELVYIPAPALAYVNNRQEELVIITDIRPDTVVCYTAKGKRIHYDHDTFRSIWTGITIVVEDNRQKLARAWHIAGQFLQKNILYILFVVLVTGLIFVFAKASISPTYLTVFLLHLAGILITVPLVKHGLQPDQSIVSRVCSGSKTARLNCNAVLDSKAANFLGFVNWSDAGFIYFAGATLTMLTQPYDPVLPFLAWLGVLPLPYTFFSVFYQAFVIRHWCLFCLLVQVLLWTQFFILTPSAESIPSTATIVQSLLPFVILLIAFIAVKPYLKKAAAYKSMITPFRQFKSSREMFYSTLQKQQKLILQPENLTLQLGNKQAPNTLVFFTNPLCSLCADTFGELLKLCKVTNSAIKVIVVFNVDPKKSTKSFVIASQLLHLYHTLPPEACVDALADWAANKSKTTSEKWMARHNLIQHHVRYDNVLNSHMDYCLLNDIKAIPSIFFNDHLLPAFYHVQDVAGFVYKNIIHETRQVLNAGESDGYI
jgi:uncharacterized membrane protein